MMEKIARHLATAKEQYDKVVFNTDALFNEPAPDPIVAFVIGGVLSCFGVLMWFHRVRMLKKKMAARTPPVKLTGNTLMRAYISCAIDSDSPLYSTISYGGASFLFLGGIQIDYKWTLLAMLSVYTVTSLGETIRVLMALCHGNSLADIIATSGFLASKLRTVSMELKPANVYEDLGRGKTIVLMVFITQLILISFVCIDIYYNGTNTCRDGTPSCPIAGTLGSWVFYVLGSFMACVYLLGPKTNYGESEQNPAYWLQLFLATKDCGAKVTWYDPIKDKQKERYLSPRDGATWIRFIMSFLINGLGFHILVHALPIQVAAQSTLTGVVLRAVGMMYLVDLDDTPGYILTIIQQPAQDAVAVADDKAGGVDSADKKVSEPQRQEGIPADVTLVNISEEAQRIIEEARQKLEALARGELSVGTNRLTNKEMLIGSGLIKPVQLETRNVVATVEPSSTPSNLKSAEVETREDDTPRKTESEVIEC